MSSGKCSVATWWLALHVHRALGLAAWGPMWVPLPGGPLAMMVPRRIPGVVGRVIPSGSWFPTPSWRGRASWGVVPHGWVFGMTLRRPRGPQLIWVTWWGRVATRTAVVPVVTGWWVPPSMAILILGPQVLLRRLVIIMVCVFDTMPTPPRWVAAAVVSRTGAWLLKPVSFFLAQMVGFGNREQITVNLHVVGRQRHAGWKKEEGKRKNERMQKKIVGGDRKKGKKKNVLHTCSGYDTCQHHSTR